MENTYIVTQETVNKLFTILKQFPWETAEAVFSVIRSEFKPISDDIKKENND